MGPRLVRVTSSSGSKAILRAHAYELAQQASSHAPNAQLGV
jgi:hypothetical protein